VEEACIRPARATPIGGSPLFFRILCFGLNKTRKFGGGKLSSLSLGRKLSNWRHPSSNSSLVPSALTDRLKNESTGRIFSRYKVYFSLLEISGLRERSGCLSWKDHSWMSYSPSEVGFMIYVWGVRSRHFLQFPRTSKTRS